MSRGGARSVRILGIDPGSRRTGYGLIESDGRHSRHVHSGCITTGAGDFAARLGIIFEGVSAVLAQHGADEVAVEQVFVARNPSAALKLGQARGAAISAVVSAGLPVFEYTPRLVKQAVVGAGGAEKQQVQHMVRILLNMNDKLVEDQADALAVALCHAHMGASRARLGLDRVR